MLLLLPFNSQIKSLRERIYTTCDEQGKTRFVSLWNKCNAITYMREWEKLKNGP